MKEDEINLEEVFRKIMMKKAFILIFTLIVTFISIVYILIEKETPVYKGEVTIEIGSIHSFSFGSIYIDNVYDLASVLSSKYDSSFEENEGFSGRKKLQIILPLKTESILVVNYLSSNKKEIKNTLNDAIKFVKSRHENKSKFYKNYISTKVIKEVYINPKPINKNKNVAIILTSLVSGLIISILLIFLFDYIRNIREKENNDK